VKLVLDVLAVVACVLILLSLAFLGGCVGSIVGTIIGAIAFPSYGWRVIKGFAIPETGGEEIV